LDTFPEPAIASDADVLESINDAPHEPVVDVSREPVIHVPPEPIVETPAVEPPAASAPPPRRYMHISTRAIVVVALAAGVAGALFNDLKRLLAGASETYADVDVPAVLLLSVFLNAVAIGMWRRHSPTQIVVQATLCNLMILGAVTLWDQDSRLLRYWLQVCIAATVVVPLLIRQVLAGQGHTYARSEWVVATTDNLLYSCMNIAVTIITATCQITLMNHFSR
jgi:hypothetical protein